ncbi:MAG: hypothetical protein LBG78_07290, partial [Azoarcus sp.]|nr:hypothetical protein [Azoarcus sp.]
MPASEAVILRAVTLPPAYVGEIAPCDFFDGNGNLLLREGVLVSENIQKKLSSRRLFCDAKNTSGILNVDPLLTLAEVGKALSTLDAQAEAGIDSKFKAETCNELAGQVYSSWQMDPDACIGFMRVASPGSPSVCQAILASLFIAELSNSHAFTRHEAIDLVGAALTMNLGSMALHDEMAELPGPLPHAFRPLVTRHPGQASDILISIGVPDTWSQAVLQHHENLNGSGYPGGLSKGSISLEARMLRLVDVFAARQRMRRGRGPQYWSLSRARDLSGLTEQIFGSDLDSLDISLARLLMGRLGLFPPGSIIRLSNGEMAIISRRSYDLVRDATLSPQEAWSFIDAAGQPRTPSARRIGPRHYRILGYAHDDLPRLPTYDWPILWGYSSQKRKNGNGRDER